MIDFKVVAHLDSATLAPMKDVQQFADQIRMGMASKKLNYTFGDIAIGKWKTYTTYSMSATENTNKNTLLVQMILIGNHQAICTINFSSFVTNEVYSFSIC
jgi:hypothetical protein